MATVPVLRCFGFGVSDDDANTHQQHAQQQQAHRCPLVWIALLFPSIMLGSQCLNGRGDTK